jgi:hypothetical protein
MHLVKIMLKLNFNPLAFSLLWIKESGIGQNKVMHNNCGLCTDILLGRTFVNRISIQCACYMDMARIYLNVFSLLF